jgi:hypothetical protein
MVEVKKIADVAHHWHVSPDIVFSKLSRAYPARFASTVPVPRSSALLPKGRWLPSRRRDALKRTFITSLLFSLSNGISPPFRNSE